MYIKKLKHVGHTVIKLDILFLGLHFVMNLYILIMNHVNHYYGPSLNHDFVIYDFLYYN